MHCNSFDDVDGYGNNKWYRNLVIARTIADTLEAMNPQYPAVEAGLENIVIPDSDRARGGMAIAPRG